MSLGVPGVPGLPLTAEPLCSYHTGSLAFGALILSLVQIARVILEYIDHKLRGEPRAGAGEGLLSSWVLGEGLWGASVQT